MRLRKLTEELKDKMEAKNLTSNYIAKKLKLHPSTVANNLNLKNGSTNTLLKIEEFIVNYRRERRCRR